mmetsp:Transcript_30406/g.34145  ORF Transcript_30406/g.34145 Transcript_30406/m.34145 type:complete len:91 (-) Transcript_30406:380-652(-)
MSTSLSLTSRPPIRNENTCVSLFDTLGITSFFNCGCHSYSNSTSDDQHDCNNNNSNNNNGNAHHHYHHYQSTTKQKWYRIPKLANQSYTS